jgi:hypothetical protein
VLIAAAKENMAATLKQLSGIAGGLVVEPLDNADGAEWHRPVQRCLSDRRAGR